MQASSTDTYGQSNSRKARNFSLFLKQKNARHSKNSPIFLEALQYLKASKKIPCNLIHLYIETKNILQMKQLWMVNRSLGMGKRCPKQTFKILPYPTIFMPHNPSTSFRQEAQNSLLWWNTSECDSSYYTMLAITGSHFCFLFD